jgi:hypothetical protein
MIRTIKNWCEDQKKEIDCAKQLLAQQPLSRYGSWEQRDRVHIFVDNSNVMIGAQRRVVDVTKLAKYLQQGRIVEERFVCGSRGDGAAEQWKTRWSDAGYEIAFDPRSGPEHFVDDALIAQAMSAANKDFPAPGRILVLVTGDANENYGRVNFRQLVTNALSHHWFVEVHTWRQSCNSWYKDMRGHNDPAVRAGFRLKYLDDATGVWKARAPPV